MKTVILSKRCLCGGNLVVSSAKKKYASMGEGLMYYLLNTYCEKCHRKHRALFHHLELPPKARALFKGIRAKEVGHF